MLVIISDLHLTDGSSGETIHEGTLRVFRERLRSLAYAASWRLDGKYQPIESLTIVLLGDIVDVLRSSQWLRGSNGKEETLRPWSNPREPGYARKIGAITGAILKRNTAFFALMRELHGSSIATVPRATQDGKPVIFGGEERPSGRASVRVQIHYMVGNHDWYLHLPHAPYDRIRHKLVNALGLENDSAQPFPHDLEEPSANPIRKVFEEHGVFARHGDIYDAFNYEGDRDTSSLGDAIAIDLLARFILEVQTQFRRLLPPQCLAGIKEIDNVRPLLMAPVWVGGMLRRTCPDPRLHRQVQEVWNDVATQFLRVPFVRDHLKSKRSCFHAEKLRVFLKMSRRSLHPGSRRLLCWLGAAAGVRKQSYFRYALREKMFKDRQARYFVYGHTHRHEMVPLDSTSSPNESGNPIYFNSGTWRPVHELTRSQPGHESFAGYNTMTYLAFFKDDERSGRGFESWSGNLGRSAAARLDPAK